jgi:acetate kinase
VTAVQPILVLNAGSSSVKFSVLDGDQSLAGGVVERIGEPGAPVPDHEHAIDEILSRPDVAGVELAAVGHRVVHGGTRFRQPVLVGDEVYATIETLTPLAPLHNPANLAGIRAARARLPELPQVAVFDTAFHATLPEPAYTYAVDRKVAQEHGVRRYGFHGISVRYVVGATARLLGRPLADLNLIVLHLGNGASATAVAGGHSVETSMGLTPLEGLVMGTRSGDLDPAVIFHLARAGLSLDEIETLLQHRGGLAGLAGENDMRAVQERADGGDEGAELALAVYCHRIRKYVGAYVAVLGRVDALVFTAGVGEHSAPIRERVLAGLGGLGMRVDPARNAGHAGVISPDGAPVAVCVVPTDEERGIAAEVRAVLAGRPE